MDRVEQISKMKSLLLRDVATLCRRAGRRWSEPIVHTLREFREEGTSAVLFGGTLRSLLISRVHFGKFGRPRDLDIVISGVSVDELKLRFRDCIRRETRFGGLQLERQNWQFDVWPLEQTWAFRHDVTESPHFHALPQTTFFNVEAIAVEVWPQKGHTRVVYSGDDQFFEGIADRVLEMNREDNPFPALCVVRSLVFAATMGFSIGPKLAVYLAKVGPSLSDDELIRTQTKHYGRLRYFPDTMRNWLDFTYRHVERCPQESIQLPPYHKQLEFWSEPRSSLPRVNVMSFSCVR